MDSMTDCLPGFDNRDSIVRTWCTCRMEQKTRLPRRSSTYRSFGPPDRSPDLLFGPPDHSFGPPDRSFGPPGIYGRWNPGYRIHIGHRIPVGNRSSNPHRSSNPGRQSVIESTSAIGHRILIGNRSSNV